MSDWLENVANLASILTAAVAVLAYGGYKRGIWDRQKRVVEKLQKIADAHPNPQRIELQEVSVLSLMVELGMSETQVLEAAFGNKDVFATARGAPGDPLATSIRLRYVAAAGHSPQLARFSGNR